MNRKRLQRILASGERNALGKAHEVSAAVASGDVDLADLFQVLEAGAEQDTVVSHGMHALRTAVENDAADCRKAIRWLRPRLPLFPQWEAREQFCRMVVAHPPRLSAALWTALAELLESKSSIVATYALEAMVVLASRDKTRRTEVDELIANGLTHQKAAVRARARKLERRRN
jgi:hypothetical protein